MASDDFEVVAFKILSYLYRCMKNGKKVDIAALRQLTGCVLPHIRGDDPSSPLLHRAKPCQQLPYGAHVHLSQSLSGRKYQGSA